MAGLRDGRLNLALVVRPPKAALLQGIRFEELFRERICLGCAASPPIATRRSVSLADAASEPFIGLTREEYPDYHSFFSVIFGPVRTKPRLIEEHDSISGVMSSVEAGLGITLRSGSAWLQFREPRETLASHARAETNLNRPLCGETHI